VKRQIYTLNNFARALNPPLRNDARDLPPQPQIVTVIEAPRAGAVGLHLFQLFEGEGCPLLDILILCFPLAFPKKLIRIRIEGGLPPGPEILYLLPIYTRRHRHTEGTGGTIPVHQRLIERGLVDFGLGPGIVFI
jgi:hypothetical protein